MRARPSFFLAMAATLAIACATLGTQGPEDQNLPTSDVGPFRKLGTKEVLGLAPYVLDGLSVQPFEEPAVLALDPSPASKHVALYVNATPNVNGKKHGAIARTRADDLVSFYGTSLDDGHAPVLVLDASLPWEGGSVHSPNVLRVGARIYLYYAAAGGVGLAVSTDGVTFEKDASPVLAPDPGASWETTAPTQPSVAVFPDGSWHMLYAAGVAIGEATSSDGRTWARVAGGPVLAPSAPVAVAALGDGGAGAFDEGQVADPCIVPRVTPAGRLQVRVLYTGYADPPGTAGRKSSIGFAARFGDAGPLERNPSVVYAVGKHEAAPALFEWSEGAMLYVHQDSSVAPAYPEIAAAVAPVTLTLPRPAGYATSP